MTTERRTRRRLLTVSVSGLAVCLAGCAGPDDDDDDGSDDRGY